MPPPRIAQRCARFHRAHVTWEGELFLTRFAAASVVTECPQMADTRSTYQSAGGWRWECRRVNEG